MEKNTNTPTTSGTMPKPGHAISDTNPRKQYVVEWHYTQYNYARVIIEATSLQEAEQKAENTEVEKWTQADGDSYIYSVEPVSGGQIHE